MSSSQYADHDSALGETPNSLQERVQCTFSFQAGLFASDEREDEAPEKNADEDELENPIPEMEDGPGFLTHADLLGNDNEDDVEEPTTPLLAPLKDRLTAAVARYRRIFKLGAKIGITASPSFTSNRRANLNEPGDDSKKLGSGRSHFFARARAITGAWGIILS